VGAARPQRFKLHLRHPRWLAGELTAKLNGEPIQLNTAPSSYATIDRKWRDGDVVELRLPMTLRSEAMPDNADRVAAFYGPILLAGNLGPGEYSPNVPVVVTESREIADWVKPESTPADAAPLRFQTQHVGRPADVPLKPFYQTYDQRHLVYWDRLSADAWQKREAEIAAERRREQELDARTIDHFAIGEMQPERDHQLTGEKTSPHEFNGRKLRHAVDGGWFAFDMTVSPNEPTDLVATYWGSESGPREFDVLVDGKHVATQSLRQDRPQKFWDRVYELPTELTSGKKKVNIRFAAKPGNYAGGVFDLRTIRRSDPLKKP
jgi:hypothetical protein